MRLTNKETKIKLSDTKRYDLQDHKMFTKLSELEDIEEKVGISLIKLFSAFNGLYYRKDNEIKFSWHIALVDWTIYILEESVEIGKGVGLGLTEYGKNWALTKEELNEHLREND